MSAKKQGDYSVGYAKPPKATQFKPGTSGNPAGRPKGAKNFKTVIEKEALSKVTVKEGGKAKTMTKMEAVVVALFHKALGGTSAAQKEALALLQIYLAEKAEEEQALSKADVAVLGNRAAFLKAVEKVTAANESDDGGGPDEA